MGSALESMKEKSAFEQERDRLHLQMLSAVSHDLKTPLAAIIGSLEIHMRFRDTLSDEKKGVLLSTALQEAYRLDSFITNILDMAKLDNSFVTVRKQTCDLDSLIADCKAKMSHLLQSIQFDILSWEEEGKTTMISTDAALLSRAINCLIDNAVKHSGPHPSIRVEYGRKDNGVAIVVIDNGPGIPEEKKEMIFDKYTRLAKKDHQNAGTGLGLAICRSITTLLGGSVSVKNSGQGAEFALFFPD